VLYEVRCRPPTTLTTESGVNQLENPNYLKWLGISYLGSMTGSVLDQAYALGHVLSYPDFMQKPCTHHMDDPGSIVAHIWPKVFTDNQIS
jgi:hypothetical protein